MSCTTQALATRYRCRVCRPEDLPHSTSCPLVRWMMFRYNFVPLEQMEDRLDCSERSEPADGVTRFCGAAGAGG